jgi:hypothetical protein
MRREPLLYWKRAEPRDRLIHGGNHRRKVYLAHVHEADDFAVIGIEPLPSPATPETNGPFAASDNPPAR